MKKKPNFSYKPYSPKELESLVIQTSVRLGIDITQDANLSFQTLSAAVLLEQMTKNPTLGLHYPPYLHLTFAFKNSNNADVFCGFLETQPDLTVFPVSNTDGLTVLTATRPTNLDLDALCLRTVSETNLANAFRGRLEALRIGPLDNDFAKGALIKLRHRS